jgi:hypothetical protein
VRKIKIFFLAAIVIFVGAMTMTSCTKNNTTKVTTDSVYSSNWITLAMTYNTTDTAYEQTFTNSGVTQNVVNEGIVLGYLGYVASAGDTVAEIASDYQLYTVFSVNTILLQSFVGDYSGALYRYVVVPGGVLTTTKLTPKELKSMSYTEVTKLLNSTAKQASSSALSTQ